MEAMAPNLAVIGDSVAATWIEPTVAGEGLEHRLRFSRLSGESWSSPVTIAEGNDFFANWADLPAVVEMGSGDLLAHWLAKTADDTYAYSIFLARSYDGGASWRSAGKLNADDTATEHGFVSWVSEGDGARAFWLDGRGMVEGGPMTLRTAHVSETIGPEDVLDERTCECCSIGTATAESGAVLVYRDRSSDETRDIARVRRRDDEWSLPDLVHADGWRIDGCPVNGPEIEADGKLAVVAWYTGATTEASRGPAVKVAFSRDSAVSFEEPTVVDAEAPIGRVDVALDDSGRAWVVWMRQVEEDAEIRLQRVGPDDEAGAAVVVGRTKASRASGFPRLVRLDESLYVAWIEISGDAQRLRLREFPIS
jgi:hypothetical protein